MEKEQKKNAVTDSGQRQDVMSKVIFGNRELCAQFLRDYVNLPFLKDVQPEDIEEYEQRYHFFDSVELNSDTVKKVRLKGTDMPELFIALIEHKSRPDYDVAMQLLQYIVCIWYNWAKTEKERLGIKEEIHKRKTFRYPPILPIVYYEGAENWGDILSIRDRVFLSGEFAPYVPDFQYILIRNRDYTGKELLDKRDEMSLLMLINKIQKLEDFEMLREIPSDQLEGILADSSESVLDVIAFTVQSLCHKLNMTEEETARYVEKVKGERDMGYLWENMEPMDIQAERRNTKEAREELERVKEELKEAKEEGIRLLIEISFEDNVSKEKIAERLKSRYHLTDDEAKEKIKSYEVKE